MKIILDAGHQPKLDNGACWKDLKEAELTRVIRDYCVNDLIKNEIKDILIVPDFKGWFKITNLSKKIQWINKNSTEKDLLVSIHINATAKTNMPDPASGVEVWGYKGLPCMSFYAYILNGVVEETGLKSRGIKDEKYHKYGKLGIVHDTNPETCCIIECGFLQGDYEILKQFPHKFGWGISHGIQNYLILKK